MGIIAEPRTLTNAVLASVIANGNDLAESHLHLARREVTLGSGVTIVAFLWLMIVISGEWHRLNVRNDSGCTTRTLLNISKRCEDPISASRGFSAVLYRLSRSDEIELRQIFASTPCLYFVVSILRQDHNALYEKLYSIVQSADFTLSTTAKACLAPLRAAC